jgi:uncharacterized membrane protein YfcA
LFALIVAFCAGLVGSFYGAAVGGGALLTVPALMFVGLSPVQAIATSRLGSLGISMSGLVAFGKSGQVDWTLGWKMTFLQGAGVLLGAWSLLQLPGWWVKKSIAVIILVILGLLAAFPSAGLHTIPIDPKSMRYRSGYILTVLLGVLTGFFQGGGGTLAAYIMILCFGQTFLQSAGTRKLPFLFGNGLALAVFIPSGNVLWGIGLALGAGTLLGGYLGSLFAIKKGNKWVRVVFFLVVGLAALRMLFSA